MFRSIFASLFACAMFIGTAASFAGTSTGSASTGHNPADTVIVNDDGPGLGGGY